ncbi:MAG: ribosome-associated translation inhibitor RaiA [Clostridia bacterium]|nr:ribosome-associated translation inhibitor RaiA [Clostridia bacterium]MBR6635510.1 ribosome-associated translation inhibitor RaiA [Clostridia bacterium]
MKITTIGRKCTLRDSFKEHAEKKLKKIDRFFGDNAEAKVTATVEKNVQIVEVTVLNGGMVFRSQERAENMNDALDLCVDSLIRQIRKNKTRIEKKLRDGAFDGYVGEYTVDEEPEYEVVRTKTVSLRPETVDEAILKMNLVGHRFYMFLNAETGNVSVVYVRNDGGYGLLEPEID